MTENISEFLKCKRDGIRKSISTLLDDWKDLEENLDSSEKFFEKKVFELNEREAVLKSMLESVKKELKNSEKFYREELQRMKAKEKSAEDMLNKMSKTLEDRIKAVDLREKEVRLRENELKSAQESIDRRSVEFQKKEAEYEVRCDEMNNLHVTIEKRLMEVRAKELKFTGRWNKLKQRENEVELKKKKFQELDSVQASVDKSLEQVNLAKEELKKEIEHINLKTAELAEKSKEVENTCKLMEEKAKEAELEKRQIKKQKRNFQLKEKMLIKNVKIEEVDGMPAHIRSYVTIDGKGLQLFLNENSNSICEKKEEVLKMIQLSTNPSMLVLDAMEGFYPPHLSKGDKTFETSVVMKSCVLLLQQLGKISPMIQSKAKERAIELAEVWKQKINLSAYNPLEVFALLHLLASYGIAADFGEDIIKFIELVAEDDQILEFCLLPGFADKIHVLIKNYIQQSRFIVAVRFICKLDLAKEFPPVPLLKSHIKPWKNITNSKDFQEGQNKAIDERLASLREVLNCILEFNLQSQYPPTILEIGIEQMLQKKKSINISKELDTLVDGDRPSTTVLTRILTNMNGQRLLQFLSKHLSEFELMQNDVSKILKRLSDPGEFVIVAIKELHSINKNNTMRTFLCVLELLAVIPFEIEIPVLEAALEVATDWKKNLSSKENPVHILAFLQLVFTYKLTHGFDTNELYQLCCSVSNCKELPGISEIISLSEKVPVSKIINYDHKITQSVRERAPLNSMADATVPDLFQLSAGPAKLLFDAMQCCYFSNLEDVKGAGTTVNIFASALKKLINVPLNINPNIQVEALEFATNWKTKLVKNTSKKQEVLCFFLFLSVYKLTSLFDCDELLCVFNFYDKNFSINLLRDFNLDKRMPEFIKNLIAKEQKLNALICIYAFNHINDFPPVPILKSYLASNGKACNKDHTPEEEGKSVVDEEITALRAVINRISGRGPIPSNDFNGRLKTLLAQKKADGENISSISQSKKQPEDVTLLAQKKADGIDVSSIPQLRKQSEDATLLAQKKADGIDVSSIPQLRKQSEDATLLAQKKADGIDVSSIPQLRKQPENATLLAQKKVVGKNVSSISQSLKQPENVTLLARKKVVGKNVSSISQSQQRPKDATLLSQKKGDGKNVSSISLSQTQPKDATLLAQKKVDGKNVSSITQSPKQPENARITVPPPSPITNNNQQENTKVVPSMSGKKRKAVSTSSATTTTATTEAASASSPPLPPRCLKRKVVSSAAATTATVAASSSRTQFRPPSSAATATVAASSARSHVQPSTTIVPVRPRNNRNHVPIQPPPPPPPPPPPITYYLHQTGHIPPQNTQTWQYEPGMTPLHFPFPIPLHQSLPFSFPPQLTFHNPNHLHPFPGTNNPNYNNRPPLRYEWPNQNPPNYTHRRY